MNKYSSERIIYDVLTQIYMNLVTEKEVMKINNTQCHKTGGELEDKLKKKLKNSIIYPLVGSIE